MNVLGELEQASCLMRSVGQHALIAGDVDLGERCEAIARRVESEAVYVRNTDLGLPRVHRRERSERRTLAELLQDPALRALRESRGLSNPPLRASAEQRSAA
jgi:hypothetical protein